MDEEDSDGDAVADATDNCPTVPNPDQANEDDDRFGDGCDPCPPFLDVVPIADADADGVSDQCDPFPAIGGDAIVVFDGLDAMPAGAEIDGNWTYDGDRATVSGAEDVLSSITWAVPVGIRTVAAHATAVEYFGTSIARPIGVVTDFDSDVESAKGITCVFGIDPSNEEVMAIADLATKNVLTPASMATARVGSSTTFFFTQQQSSYSCEGSAITAPIRANPTAVVPLPRMGIFTRSASASFDWAMMISSP